MLSGLPWPDWAMDGDGSLCCLNAAWWEFTGVLPHALNGSWPDSVGHEDRELLQRATRASFATHEPLRVEFRLRRSDGALRWMHGEGAVVTREGETLGLLGSCFDVTDGVRTIQELRRENEALRRGEGVARGTPVRGEKAGATASRPQDHGTILIVDDEAVVRDTVRRILAMRGYDVLSAQDGVKGVELFRSHRSEISLALIDLSMPHQSGAVTLRKLRQMRPDLPALMMSGYGVEEFLDEFAGVERVAFVGKPFSASQLLTDVKNMLESGLIDAG